MNPYEALAEAILLQAAEDYRLALRRLRHHPKDPKGRELKNDCESFFHSQFFGTLTSLDPKEMIRRMNEEVGGRCRSRLQESYPLRTTSTR